MDNFSHFWGSTDSKKIKDGLQGPIGCAYPRAASKKDQTSFRSYILSLMWNKLGEVYFRESRVARMPYTRTSYTTSPEKLAWSRVGARLNNKSSE